MREWAVGAGRERLRRVRRRRGRVHAAARAGDGVRRRGQPRLHARRLRRRSARLYKDRDRIAERFRPARASAGTSTTRSCSSARSYSSAPATGPTWSPSGCRRSRASREKLSAGAQGRRHRLRPRHSTMLMAKAYPNSTSTASTTTTRSIERARQIAERRGRRGQHRVRGRHREGLPRRRTTTWSASSTACTTWAIPVGAMRTCARRSPTTARCCWSSRSPTTRWTENLNPVGRMFYAASTMLCTPDVADQEVGLGLGAQAGEARLARRGRARPGSAASGARPSAAELGRGQPRNRARG